MSQNCNDFEIEDSSYGKDGVKILYLSRNGLVHTIKELECSARFTLASHTEYTDSDNSKIIDAESQKNTVYILAKKLGVKSPEHFGSVLCHHFLKTYDHVTKVSVYLEEVAWERIKYDEQISGKQHNHAFIHSPLFKRCTTLEMERDEKYPTIVSGIKDLRVLKSTKSSFLNFVENDDYRSYQGAFDRVFGTVVDCSWEYSNNHQIDFNEVFRKIQQLILMNFAGDLEDGVQSTSLQSTIYLTEKDILEKVKEVKSIKMTLPNLLFVRFDFSKFKKIVSDDEETVLVPVDKPVGAVYAKLRRKMSKL